MVRKTSCQCTMKHWWDSLTPHSSWCEKRSANVLLYNLERHLVDDELLYNHEDKRNDTPRVSIALRVVTAEHDSFKFDEIERAMDAHRFNCLMDEGVPVVYVNTMIERHLITIVVGSIHPALLRCFARVPLS